MPLRRPGAFMPARVPSSIRGRSLVTGPPTWQANAFQLASNTQETNISVDDPKGLCSCSAAPAAIAELEATLQRVVK